MVLLRMHCIQKIECIITKISRYLFFFFFFTCHWKNIFKSSKFFYFPYFYVLKVRWLQYMLCAIVEYRLGNEISIYGNVYSYGILLLEMFTRNRPTDNMFNQKSQAQSAQIIFKQKKKKKKKEKEKKTHIINCKCSLSKISFFLFLYLCLFSTQLIILEVQSNWIRNGWSLKCF